MSFGNENVKKRDRKALSRAEKKYPNLMKQKWRQAASLSH